MHIRIAQVKKRKRMRSRCVYYIFFIAFVMYKCVVLVFWLFAIYTIIRHVITHRVIILNQIENKTSSGANYLYFGVQFNTLNNF